MLPLCFEQFCSLCTPLTQLGVSEGFLFYQIGGNCSDALIVGSFTGNIYPMRAFDYRNESVRVMLVEANSKPVGVAVETGAIGGTFLCLCIVARKIVLTWSRATPCAATGPPAATVKANITMQVVNVPRAPVYSGPSSVSVYENVSVGASLGCCEWPQLFQPMLRWLVMMNMSAYSPLCAALTLQSPRAVITRRTATWSSTPCYPRATMHTSASAPSRAAWRRSSPFGMN